MIHLLYECFSCDCQATRPRFRGTLAAPDPSDPPQTGLFPGEGSPAPLKHSVYVLPHTEECLEDFRWLLREIVSEGGEATICEAGLVEGFTRSQLEEVFRAARDPDYAEITTATEQLLSTTAKAEEGSPEVETDLPRLRRRLEEVQAIDYFGSAGGPIAERALARL